MRDLTLEQVKASGRPATWSARHGRDNFFWSGRDGGFLSYNFQWWGDSDHDVLMIEVPQTGWHHIEPCSCDLCRD